MAAQDLNQWVTSPDYHKQDLNFPLWKFIEVTDLLLERPNLNSSHLFRADILSDSRGKFQTLLEKEQTYGVNQSSSNEEHTYESLKTDAPQIQGYNHERTVVRRLIPRNSQLDQPLEQSCYIYYADSPSTKESTGRLVIYLPHADSERDMPWYHPPVKALAYKYEQAGSTSISIHFLPFTKNADPIPNRLHRTFISLIQTVVRLSKLDKPESTPTSNASTTAASRSTAPWALKDTILPQHTVQDTYAHLKHKYAVDLIGRWVESTEPSKHVFEDISIAAFLIELWKLMYKDTFPGFVDIACGNGVLVYILIKEGYHGCGFDARRRKTWDILDINSYLEEKICIPKPFLDSMADGAGLDMSIHDGIFGPGTFIVSNHADELTPWTPILSAFSNPESPLPFLAIPCCSHALSGARHRYTPKEINSSPTSHSSSVTDLEDQNPQPSTGDLKALQKQKAKASTHQDDKSQYACLTRKVVALAEELNFDVELTLMRIPSTRNIGIVGNRKAVMQCHGQKQTGEDDAIGDKKRDDMNERIEELLRRECSPYGGIEASAKTWIEKAKALQRGSGGRGKVNLKGRMVDANADAPAEGTAAAVVAHED